MALVDIEARRCCSLQTFSDTEAESLRYSLKPPTIVKGIAKANGSQSSEFAPGVLQTQTGSFLGL